MGVIVTDLGPVLSRAVEEIVRNRDIRVLGNSQVTHIILWRLG